MSPCFTSPNHIWSTRWLLNKVRSNIPRMGQLPTPDWCWNSWTVYGVLIYRCWDFNPQKTRQVCQFSLCRDPPQTASAAPNYQSGTKLTWAAGPGLRMTPPVIIMVLIIALLCFCQRKSLCKHQFHGLSKNPSRCPYHCTNVDVYMMCTLYLF